MYDVTFTMKFDAGLLDYRGAFVTFKSRATTRRGLLRAMAKAAVKKAGTDVIEVDKKVLVKGQGVMELTNAERYDVWRMAHDLMMGA